MVPSPSLKSDEILARLLSLHPRLIDLSLDRILGLLAKLGNPQDRLPPTVHVAGTNGKGSTIATMRAILEKSGAKVHVYTSPHLVSFRERIRLAGVLIGESELSALLEEVEQVNDKAPITLFEITTAAAFLAFSRTPADVLLLEVGLGGRLDATNCLKTSAVSLITSLSLDHESYLGSDLKGIAREKAGIMRRNVPVIIAPQADPLTDVLKEEAERIGAIPACHGEDWQSYKANGRLILQDHESLLDLPLPSLYGDHQISNAGAAIMALRALNLTPVSEKALADGLTSINWPGRLQPITEGRLVDLAPQGSELWLDGGHNEGAAITLAAAMRERHKTRQLPLYLIFAMLDTKAPAAFIRAFEGLAEHIMTLTLTASDQAIKAETLKALISQHCQCPSEACHDLGEAVSLIGRLSQNQPARILFSGSLYLVGDVLRANEGPYPT